MPSPQRAKTVTTTASQIISADPTNRPVWLQIDGNTTVFVGDSTVTPANGFPLSKNSAPLGGQLAPGQSLWAVVASGTETVRIFSTPED